MLIAWRPERRDADVDNCVILIAGDRRPARAARRPGPEYDPQAIDAALNTGRMCASSPTAQRPAGDARIRPPLARPAPDGSCGGSRVLRQVGPGRDRKSTR